MALFVEHFAALLVPLIILLVYWCLWSMSTIRHLLSNFRRERPRPSRPSDLPTDVLFYMMQRFPTPADAAAFALLDRNMVAKVGDYFLRVKGLSPSLLMRMARDRPAHWHCARCRQLHPNDIVPGIVTALGQALSECIRTRETLFLASHHFTRCRIIYPHVHLLMKRHYLGVQHGISLTDLHVTEVQTYSGKIRRLQGYVTLSSMEPAIISDELYLRIQSWSITSLSKAASHVMTFMRPCFHSAIESMMRQALDMQLSAIGSGFEESFPHYIVCPWCRMITQLTVQPFKNGQVAATMTKWLNVGDGSSVPGQKWYRYVEVVETRANNVNHRHAEREAWRIQRTFENHYKLALSACTAANQLILQDSQYLHWENDVITAAGFTSRFLREHSR